MGSFFEFVKNSFFHVAPILTAGAFAIAIMLERARALFLVYPLRSVDAFFDRIQDLVLARKVGEAVTFCDKFPDQPAAQVVKQALLRAHQPEALIENGLQLAVGEATQRIQKRTSFLATIANVATLLGLFGTIAGLIHSFEAVGHADPQQKSALLAAGISTAMNATMMGLAVAIPCMIAFSFLMNRTNVLTAQIEHAAVRALDVLKQSYYAAEAEAFGGMTSKADPDPESPDSKDEGGKKGGKTSLRRVV